MRTEKGLAESFRLDGKLALVTGASRGIGFGIAQAMAEAGADVLLVARDSAHLREAEGQLRTTGRRIAAVPFDMHDYAEVGSWYEQLVGEHGIPDVLVNNAGVTKRAPAEDLPLAEWEEVIAVNLSAVFALSQAFARHLIAAGRQGKIVNIASLMTAAARRTTAAYTASKGGIGQLTKALAVDWAGKGIYVNAIAPGYVATDLTSALSSDATFDAWVKQRTPLARWGTPVDIARPAVFLASAASDFITGEILYVDGGWMATF